MKTNNLIIIGLVIGAFFFYVYYNSFFYYGPFIFSFALIGSVFPLLKNKRIIFVFAGISLFLILFLQKLIFDFKEEISAIMVSSIIVYSLSKFQFNLKFNYNKFVWGIAQGILVCLLFVIWISVCNNPDQQSSFYISLLVAGFYLMDYIFEISWMSMFYFVIVAIPVVLSIKFSRAREFFILNIFLWITVFYSWHFSPPDSYFLLELLFTMISGWIILYTPVFYAFRQLKIRAEGCRNH